MFCSESTLRCLINRDILSPGSDADAASHPDAGTDLITIPNDDFTEFPMDYVEDFRSNFPTIYSEWITEQFRTVDELGSFKLAALGRYIHWQEVQVADLAERAPRWREARGKEKDVSSCNLTQQTFVDACVHRYKVAKPEPSLQYSHRWADDKMQQD